MCVYVCVCCPQKPPRYLPAETKTPAPHSSHAEVEMENPGEGGRGRGFSASHETVTPHCFRRRWWPQ